MAAAIDIHADYSAEVQVPSTASFLEGELSGAVLMGAQFIDGAAFAFMAQEAGAVVTQLDGSPLPPLSDYADTYRWPPLAIGRLRRCMGIWLRRLGRQD